VEFGADKKQFDAESFSQNVEQEAVISKL